MFYWILRLKYLNLLFHLSSSFTVFTYIDTKLINAENDFIILCCKLFIWLEYFPSNIYFFNFFQSFFCGSYLSIFFRIHSVITVCVFDVVIIEDIKANKIVTSHFYYNLYTFRFYNWIKCLWKVLRLMCLFELHSSRIFSGIQPC